MGNVEENRLFLFFPLHLQTVDTDPPFQANEGPALFRLV